MNSDGYTSADKQNKRMELTITIQYALPASWRDSTYLCLMEGHNLEHNKWQSTIYSSLIKFLFCRDLKEHYKQKNSHGFNET